MKNLFYNNVRKLDFQYGSEDRFMSENVILIDDAGEWIAEKPELREKLVKTGWEIWKKKWREKHS